MQVAGRKKRTRRIILILGAFLGCILLFLLFFINRFLEPVLRDRLHTLIIQGSDSLYRYRLGSLKTHFLGGTVEVENLHIRIDSNRYRQLSARNALPSLTMELHLVKGSVKGIGIFALVFGKKISIHEIVSQEANIRLLRHIRRNEEAPQLTQPLWKTIQPAIRSIAIGRIHLNGVKLLYRNADTSASLKLQFDRCEAVLDDIRVDSTAWADTARIAFAREVSMRFNDLKFRTPDSSYKMKAELITYSSRLQALEVHQFKIQPTLEDRESFYRAVGRQESMHVVTFQKALFTRLRLDQFFNRNTIIADTVFLDQPEMSTFMDRTQPRVLESKVGKFPHQRLLKAHSTIKLKGVVVRNASVTYTEKNAKTLQEGQLQFRNLNLRMTNVTNDAHWIRRNPRCAVAASGNLLGSPLSITFNFYLDSANGRFDASGTIRNMSATQLNKLAEPLANTKLRSFDMQQLNFSMQGNDLGATSQVSMRYNNLFVVLQKQDEETGAIKTKKFLTKLLNKFTLYDSNPGPEGHERRAENAKALRLSTQAFFGLLWKSLFKGMQQVMFKSGRYE